MKRLSRSFEYIFAEDDWFNSVLIGGVYIVLTPLVIGVIMVMGFQVELTRGVMRGEKRMPLWRNPAVLYRSGIGSFAVSLCYAAVIVLLLLFLQVPLISLTTVTVLVSLHFFLNPLVIERYAATQSFWMTMDPIVLARSAMARFASYLGGVLLTSSLILAAVMFGWMWIVVGWPILIFLMLIVQTMYFTV